MPETEQVGNDVWTALMLHNAWANLKLLDACAGLREEQLAASAPGTYGAIRDTLVHLVQAELNYTQRVNGPFAGAPFPAGQFPGFAALTGAARWSGDALVQLARSGRADPLVVDHRPHLPAIRQYPFASLMMQVINHATEHRTQVSTILTQLGLEPPDMSGWAYMVEMGEYQEFPRPDAG